jgi:predicted TIM-barrel fold metal-dependent hydrolase
MVGTPFMNDVAPLSRDTIGRLADLQDRVVLGSDFPNIPYAYAVQLEALEAFGHSSEWLRAVCWYNGVRLLGNSVGDELAAGIG